MTPDKIKAVADALLPVFMTHTEALWVCDPEEGDSPTKPFYRALALLLAPGREALGLDCMPTQDEAEAILRAMHPYFVKNIDECRGSFVFNYNFVHNAWK